MFKRPYLNKPYQVGTDNGGEFKREFKQYLNKHSIRHKVSEPYRHSQQANVERLNRTLGRLLNGYMNARALQTMKAFREWTEALPLIREKLNKLRKKPNKNPFGDTGQAQPELGASPE